jgi:hypothetical protein
MKKPILLIGGFSVLTCGFLFSTYFVSRKDRDTGAEKVLIDGTIPREKAKKIFDQIASQYIKNVGKNAFIQFSFQPSTKSILILNSDSLV